MKVLPPGWGASQQPVFETKLPLAVQLYSVKDLLAKDLLGTLQQVKNAGYDGVEFYGGLSYLAQDVLFALKQTGLQIVGWHTPWEYLSPENIYATITYNKVIGNQYVDVPWMPDEILTNRENCLQFAAQLTWVSDVLAKHDMVVGYHNHATEVQPIAETGELPWDLIARNTPSTVILQHDIGNGLSGGGDMMGLLKKYPGRTGTLHMKPWSAESRDTFFDDPNCTINWDEYFEVCRKEAGVRWYIVEYMNNERYGDPIAALAASAKWFRSRGGK